ncbi:MAG: hypothetical protein WC256_13250 [Desulfurivibrionaceae bacterium]|jgi:ppGpp synthetase/RelA/SpoT-type nucleotidyltranferase
MKLDKTQVREKYEQLKPLYSRLANNVNEAIVKFLVSEGIEFIEVDNRVKEFNSFWEKIVKNGYEKPFEQIHDLCALRIINYYESDERLIEKLLTKEFNIFESDDKKECLALDQFGYRSKHYIAEIQSNWLAAPNYRGLKGLKFEIQSRTILMHSWAAINHKLSYKKEKDIPPEFKRSLFRLSALIELADQQFDILRNQQKEYMASFVKKSPEGELEFDIQAPLNVDSLKALLSVICPDRHYADQEIADLIEEVREVGAELSDIYMGYKQIHKYMPEIEEETYTCMGDSFDPMKDGWSQEGFVRTILDITFDAYWEKRIIELPKEVVYVTDKWREIAKKAQPTN